MIDFTDKMEYAKCAGDFDYFAKKHLEIWCNVERKMIPLTLMAHQNEIIETCNTSTKTYLGIVTYRQSGITTLFCAYIAWLMTFQYDTSIVVASHSSACANEMVDKVRRFLKGLPHTMNFKFTTDNKTQIVLDNGCSLRSVIANNSGVRGSSPDFVFVDDAAHIKQLEEFIYAMYGSLQNNGKVVVNSNPKGTDYFQYMISDMEMRGIGDVIRPKWFNDPRFNKDLSWVETNGELKPTSPWYERMKVMYNEENRAKQELDAEFI
jgi:hypothetical protein